MVASVSELSNKNYKSAGKKLVMWLNESGRSLSVKAFLDYLVDCYQAGLSYQHVNSVRSFVALQEKLHTGEQKVTGSAAVKTALKGYERLTPREVVRAPLKINHLDALLASQLCTEVKLSCLLGYLFLLRTSEVASLFNGEGSLKETKAGWRLFLGKSKGDRKSSGVSVLFNSELLNAILSRTLKQWRYLLAPERAVPGDVVNAGLHTLFGPQAVFHCWRHGRATELFEDGMPLPKLQLLGRWATKSALRCYLH